MTTAVMPKRLPELPRPGQKVRWRDSHQARAWGWQEVFGAGPFEVVGTVDKTKAGLAAGLIVRTNLGEQEINEVWLDLADAPTSIVGVKLPVPLHVPVGPLG